MSGGTETLSELVDTRIKELGKSLRTLARSSGGLVAYGELSTLRRRDRADISEAKIIGLARALEVDEQRVREAVETTKTRPPLELPGRLNLLNPDMRTALIAVGDSLLDLQRKLTAAAGRRPDTARQRGPRTPRT